MKDEIDKLASFLGAEVMPVIADATGILGVALSLDQVRFIVEALDLAESLLVKENAAAREINRAAN